MNEGRQQHRGLLGHGDVGNPAVQFLENQRDFATGEVGAEAEMDSAATEPDVVVRGARHIELPGVGELVLIAVGRGVPHGYLVAGGDLDPAEFNVSGGGAPHVHHRGCPAHDLLDSRRRMGLEIVPPDLPLLRVAGQCQHAVTDRIAGGLVAGDSQQDEERGDLGRRELFAVDVGDNQCSGQIIAWVGPAILGQCGGVCADIDGDLHELLEVGAEVRVAETKDDVGPVEDRLVILLRNPHHVADHLQRKRSGEFGHEFAVTVGMVGDQILHQSAGTVADGLLDAGHHFGGERAAHDIAQPGVARIVHGDHRPEVLGHLWRLVGDGDVRDRTEDIRVPAGVVDVVELHQCPVARTRGEAFEADLVEELDRRLPAQGRERSVSDRVVKGPELQGAEVDIRQRDRRRCLAIDAGFDAHMDKVPSFVE